MTFGRFQMTRRGLVAAAVIGLAAIIVIVIALSGPAVDRVASTGTDTPTPTPTPTTAPTASVLPTPRTTPPGTPGPVPSEPNASAASIDLSSLPPQATPSATPQAGLWRIQGYVVDEDGAPLSGVCVVIGPNGCKPFSPKTDERGQWFLDVAEGHTTFDFYFEMPGHQTLWWHVTPDAPIEFNLVLAKG